MTFMGLIITVSASVIMSFGLYVQNFNQDCNDHPINVKEYPLWAGATFGIYMFMYDTWATTLYVIGFKLTTNQKQEVFNKFYD